MWMIKRVGNGAKLRNFHLRCVRHVVIPDDKQKGSDKVKAANGLEVQNGLCRATNLFDFLA